ncbi:hypothetical protein MASR1M68_02050 [Elusimicrobiota bacterium]
MVNLFIVSILLYNQNEDIKNNKHIINSFTIRSLIFFDKNQVSKNKKTNKDMKVPSMAPLERVNIIENINNSHNSTNKICLKFL